MVGAWMKKSRFQLLLNRIWNDKTPRGRVLFIEYLCWWFMRFGGVESCGPRYYTSIQTYICHFIFLFVYVCVALTCISYRDDKLTIIKAFIALPACLDTQWMLITAIGRRNTIARHLTLYNSQHLYATDEVDDYRNLKIQQMKPLIIYFFTFVGGFILLTIISIAVPTYEFMFKNEPFYIYHLFLPFMDPYSMRGVIINNIFQSIVFAIVMVTHYGILTAWVLGLNVVYTQIAIIKFDLQKAAKMKPPSALHVLRRISETDQYIITASEYTYVHFMIAPFVLGCALVVGVVLGTLGVWTNGLPFAVGVYLFMFVPCYLGQKVTDAYSEMADALMEYWYVFPLKEQKVMCHMLCRLQNGAQLTMGPFSALDLMKFQDITKSLYNFTLALMKMIG